MINLCALDLSKAFDKMDHIALFVNTYMEETAHQTFMHNWNLVSIVSYLRSFGFHNSLLQIIGRHAPKWHSFSLFAIFIDNDINKIICCGKGCHLDVSASSYMLKTYFCCHLPLQVFNLCLIPATRNFTHLTCSLIQANRLTCALAYAVRKPVFASLLMRACLFLGVIPADI